jgi:hypothetical protein
MGDIDCCWHSFRWQKGQWIAYGCLAVIHIAIRTVRYGTVYRSTAWNGNGQVEVDKVVSTSFRCCLASARLLRIAWTRLSMAYRNVYFIMGQIGSLMFSNCTVLSSWLEGQYLGTLWFTRYGVLFLLLHTTCIYDLIASSRRVELYFLLSTHCIPAALCYFCIWPLWAAMWCMRCV